MDWVYLSNNSVGYITASIMAVVATVYLFLIKQKSRKTWYLCCFLVSQSLLCIGYVIWFSFYTPGSAYATYLIYLIWIGLIFLIQFAYHYPKNIHPGESRIALAVSILACFVAYAQYISQTQPMEYDLRFDIHSFYPRALSSELSLAFVFLGCPIWTVIVLIRKTISLSALNKQEKKAALKLSSTSTIESSKNIVDNFLAANSKIFNPLGKEAKAAISVVPPVLIMIMIAICFCLYKSRVMSYGTFTYINITASILFCFFLVKAISSNLSDKSCSMQKLVGISLVTTLILIETIACFSIGYIEDSYYKSREDEVAVVKTFLKNGNLAAVPDKVEYVVSMPINNDNGDVDERDINLVFVRNNDFQLITFVEGIKKSGLDYIERQLLESDSGNEAVLRSFIRVSGNVNSIFYKFFLNDMFYIVGYDYLDLRVQIHGIASLFVYITLVSTLIIIFGFPLFYKSLLKNSSKKISAVIFKNINDDKVDLSVELAKPASKINILPKTEPTNKAVQLKDDLNLKLKSYANNLEELVKARGADLQRSTREIQLLKEQQSGDYLQAALLLKPFTTNNVKSETVNIEFLIKQKSQFQFRDGKEQIGGDICSADTIYLSKSPFTLFLNADAMGRSIQGAYGALMLGAVFESIVERTKFDLPGNDLYPEQWLRNNFLEIQKVFSKFNGSMFVSMLFGLVDDKTGLMYYVNAGHPRNVLYRNKRANFIEDKTAISRLGNASANGNAIIQLFQLNPNDIIIAGSNGRDDFLMNKDNGRRFVNEDKSLFLKRLEECDGELEKVYNNIKKHGELRDDISLLRISYVNNGLKKLEEGQKSGIDSLIKQSQSARIAGNLNTALIAAEKAFKTLDDDPTVLKELVQVHALIKNYEKAVNIADDYINLCPADTNFLYITAFCLKKAGNLEKSALIGERVLIREPNMVKNLVNLSHVYLLMKNYSKANYYIERALLLDANNKNAKSIQASLSGKLREATTSYRSSQMN